MNLAVTHIIVAESHVSAAHLGKSVGLCNVMLTWLW